MFLTKGVSIFRPGGFARSAGILASGIAIAHAITAVAMPFATRLYTPHDYSVLATFVGLVSILGTAACLRFDIAVPLPESHGDAANLLALALMSCTCVAVLSAAVLAIEPWWLTRWLDQPSVLEYKWLLPPAVLLFGLYSALQGWFVRMQRFASIARARISQSATGAGIQLGLGLAGVAPVGLLVGQVITSAGGAIGLGISLWRGPMDFRSLVSRLRMGELAVRYRRFPTYSTLESLCNTGSMQVPVILIASYAAGPEAGFLLLAMSVMQAPIGLIGTSVSQVFSSRAPVEMRSGTLAEFTLNVYEGLMKTGVGLLLFVGIVAPGGFSLIFGEGWRRAGVLVTWLTPWFVMQLLVVPVSIALHITNRLRAAFALQGIGLVVRVLAVVLAARYAPSRLAEAYAISGLLFYAAYGMVVLHAVDATPRMVLLRTLRALPALVAWAVVAALIALSFEPLAGWVKQGVAMVG